MPLTAASAVFHMVLSKVKCPVAESVKLKLSVNTYGVTSNLVSVPTGVTSNLMSVPTELLQT
jgi:hypothetical protein